MKKLMILACALTLAMALPALAAQPAMPEQPLEMKGSKKSVMFPHAPHAKIECGACHHPVDGKENFQKCGTSGCHDDLVGKKGTKSLYFVTHARKDTKYATCVACHTKTVAEKPDLKKALTDCAKSKCHP